MNLAAALRRALDQPLLDQCRTEFIGQRDDAREAVAAAWLAFARWAVGVTPSKPTLADEPAPTVISQEYAPAWRFTA